MEVVSSVTLQCLDVPLASTIQSVLHAKMDSSWIQIHLNV